MNSQPTAACSLCESPARLMEENFTGYKVDMHFSIYQCPSCHTSFPLPLVNADQIYDFIYKNGERVPAYDRYWQYFKQVKNQTSPLAFLADREEVYWGIREALQEIKQKVQQPSILEVGCGLGYLTYALKTEGYHIQGLDISSEAIENARRHFGDFYICDNLFSFVNDHRETYDVIILTEVIEHVNDPLAFLQTIAALLKKGGKAIVTTPNRSLVPDDIAWDTELPPVHQWWFSEESMQYMANRLQLKLDFVSYQSFYNLHPKEYIVKRNKKKSFRIPIIDENWQFYSHALRNAPTLPEVPAQQFPAPAETVSAKNTFKKILLQVKAFFLPSTIVCGEKGNTLCAAFEK